MSGGDDRVRWNARYGAEEGLRRPSPFLLRIGDRLPAAGRTLDVAGGSGRNAIWLARRGLSVLLADISDVALERALDAASAAGVTIETLRLDLEHEPLPLGPFDSIVCVDFLSRPLFAQLDSCLRDGGHFAMSHPTVRNLERHPHPSPRYLLDEGELLTLASPFEIVMSEEGWDEEGRHTARLLARKRRSA